MDFLDSQRTEKIEQKNLRVTLEFLKGSVPVFFSMLLLFFSAAYFVGAIIPERGFRGNTLQRRLASFNQRLKKKSNYKIIGACTGSRYGNFDEFTNLAIGATTYKDSLYVLNNYCKPDDIIFHLLTVQDSFDRERGLTVFDHPVIAKLDQFRFYFQDSILNKPTTQNSVVTNPEIDPLGVFAGVTRGMDGYDLWVKIANGEFEKVSSPLVDTEFLNQESTHFNVIFILAPYKHEVTEDPAVQKTVEMNEAFRKAMYETDYALLDLTDLLPLEAFYRDWIHHSVKYNSSARKAMTLFRKRLDEELKHKALTDGKYKELPEISRHLNDEIRSASGLEVGIY